MSRVRDRLQSIQATVEVTSPRTTYVEGRIGRVSVDRAVVAGGRGDAGECAGLAREGDGGCAGVGVGPDAEGVGG